MVLHHYKEQSRYFKKGEGAITQFLNDCVECVYAALHSWFANSMAACVCKACGCMHEQRPQLYSIRLIHTVPLASTDYKVSVSFEK